jgi:hypothetical protein
MSSHCLPSTTEFSPHRLHPDTLSAENAGYAVSLFKHGARAYEKTRYPQKHGLYHEIRTPSATLQFNLNNEIVIVRGLDGDWPSSREWLKRSPGNDWVYYSTGGYGGTHEIIGSNVLAEPIRFRIPTPYNEVYRATGEYYLPNLPYPSNAILGGSPFENPAVGNLLAKWHKTVKEAATRLQHAAKPFGTFLEKAMCNSPERLKNRADRLHGIIGGRMSVLSPDTRHVDYNVIPLRVTEGCLYHCRFCRVKSGKTLQHRSMASIEEQIRALKTWFGPDRVNYNALFLGGNDGLAAGKDLLLSAVEKAAEELGLTRSFLDGFNVFLFGSVDSFLAADTALFDALQTMNCRTYINLGLESADPKTLNTIGKPITARQVKKAFAKMLEINRRFSAVEVTANFLMDESLPESHYRAFVDLVRGSLSEPIGKGSIYFSPLCLRPPSQHSLYFFNQLQAMSRLPVYLYLIQRL